MSDFYNNKFEDQQPLFDCQHPFWTNFIEGMATEEGRKAYINRLEHVRIYCFDYCVSLFVLTLL